MGKWIKRLAMVLTAAVLAGAVYGGLRQAGAYAPENPMDEPAEQYSLIRASEDLEAGSGAGDFYFDISSEFEQEAQDEENPEPEQTEPDPGARQTETGETEGQMLSGGTVLTGGEETGEQEDAGADCRKQDAQHQLQPAGQPFLPVPPIKEQVVKAVSQRAHARHQAENFRAEGRPDHQNNAQRNVSHRQQRRKKR